MRASPSRKGRQMQRDAVAGPEARQQVERVAKLETDAEQARRERIAAQVAAEARGR